MSNNKLLVYHNNNKEQIYKTNENSKNNNTKLDIISCITNINQNKIPNNSWIAEFQNYSHYWNSKSWKKIYDNFPINSDSEYENNEDNSNEKHSIKKDSYETIKQEINQIYLDNDVEIIDDESYTKLLKTIMEDKINESNHSIKKFKRKGNKSKVAITSICLEPCSYELVATIAKKFGMKIVNSNDLWDIYWSDSCTPVDIAKKMRRYQRTNHFPGIFELCRKNLLAKNLNHMKKYFPEDYNFFPKTWILPMDNHEVHSYLSTKKGTVIVKPDNGSNGTGIFLVRNLRHVNQDTSRNYICQVYIPNPFLIDGYKFDIRIYTLITSCDPLRLYVYNDGIVRFATVKYEKPNQKNLKNLYMHLTNYSLNKYSISFIHDGEIGSKRKISTLNEWFIRHEYDVETIWSRIDDVIVKTILSAYPSMKSNYRSCFTKHNYTTACFQLLGLDILLDENLNPYVLEVNHSPSFHTDSRLDLDIKEKVLHDTFILCNLNKSIKKKVIHEDRIHAQRRLYSTKFNRKCPPKQEEFLKFNKEPQWLWEKKHMGNFRLLYPCIDGDKYDSILFNMERTILPYKDTICSSMRTLLGRTQRQEIQNKKEKDQISLKKTYQSINDVEQIYSTKKKENDKKNCSIRKKTLISKETNESKLKEKDLKITKQSKSLIKQINNKNEIKTNFAIKKITKNSVKKEKKITDLKINKNIDLKEMSRTNINELVEPLNTHEENERIKDLKERESLIELHGIRESIYSLFKQTKNLSSRDLEVFEK